MNGVGDQRDDDVARADADQRVREQAGSAHPAGLTRRQARKALLLPPLGVEIFAPEPALERRLARGPLAVEHRKPGGVAAAALDDHVLAEDALEGEAEPLRRAPRGRVQRVAFPLVAPVAERIEDVGGEEILRLGRARRALQGGRVHDIADLDDAVRRIDAHEGLVAERAARGVVDHGEEQRVLRARFRLEARAEVVQGRVGPVAEVGPDALPLSFAVRAVVKRNGVLMGVERSERDIAPLEGDALRAQGGMGVDLGADGLFGA